MSTLAVYLNNSPARCVTLPTPADAYCSLPGCFFASATSSATELTGRLGLTTSTTGLAAMMATGAKDLIGS